MPAYVIATFTEAHDDETLAEYRRRNTDTVAAHRGRFVVRGGSVDALEGGPAPLRVVVIEFPDAAAARGWYESAEYQEILPLRQRASTADVLLVESAG